MSALLCPVDERATANAGAVPGCDLSRHSFARIAQLITAEVGIQMPETKHAMVQSRLLRRAGELGLLSVEQYIEHVFATREESEQEQLVNAITTNKTDFFREPQHFDYLTRFALPSLRSEDERRQPVTLKVWSAGCSSGQEPYTLAMVLNEYVAGRHGMDFAILATDVSTKVLAEGRAAIYPEAQIAPVPLAMRRLHLALSRERENRKARVLPHLRRKVRFHQLNFMAEDYPIRDVFDAIFFRNVMIYFDRATQESVIRKLSRHLAPGGYLFIGHSESLAGLDIPLKGVHASVFRKIG
jgi:chemotaxis protein methyltransferase CheR